MLNMMLRDRLVASYVVLTTGVSRDDFWLKKHLATFEKALEIA